MNEIFKLLIGLIFISALIISGCKKESTELPTDPADKFVGNYSYIMTVPALGSQSGDLTITKNASNKISLLQAGSTTTLYTVDGNDITEDSEQTGDIPVAGGGTAIFTENSTGSISGNVITINGTWTNPNYTTMTFKIVATMKKTNATAAIE